MNFQETIDPLTKFLDENDFSVIEQSHNFIKYASNFAIITIAFSDREYLYYIHVGQSPESLIQLTEVAVKEVFKYDIYIIKSTKTVDNWISFFKKAGKGILLGDKKIFEKINEFSEQQSKEYKRQLTHLQNIQEAKIISIGFAQPCNICFKVFLFCVSTDFGRIIRWKVEAHQKKFYFLVLVFFCHFYKAGYLAYTRQAEGCPKINNISCIIFFAEIIYYICYFHFRNCLRICVSNPSN